MADNYVLEFSRPLVMETVKSNSVKKQRIEATKDELEALAKRLLVKSISNLAADIKLERLLNDTVRVSCNVKADIVQSCIISLEDIPAHLDFEAESLFSEKGEVFEGDSGDDLEVEDEFNFAIKDGVLDLGELVAQYLSVEIDPYPRVEGAEFKEPVAEDSKKNNPFAVLEGLKGKK